MADLKDPIYIPVWLAIVAGLPQILTIVSHFILQLKLNRLQKDVNGRMSQLIDTTARAEHAKGYLAAKKDDFPTLNKNISQERPEEF